MKVRGYRVALRGFVDYNRELSSVEVDTKEGTEGYGLTILAGALCVVGLVIFIFLGGVKDICKKSKKKKGKKEKNKSRLEVVEEMQLEYLNNLKNGGKPKPSLNVSDLNATTIVLKKGKERTRLLKGSFTSSLAGYDTDANNSDNNLVDYYSMSQGGDDERRTLDRLERQRTDDNEHSFMHGLILLAPTAQARRRGSMFENYLSFQRNSANTTSRLSHVLTTKFSATIQKGKSRTLAQTLSSIGDKANRASLVSIYKTKLTENDRKRHKRVHTVSVQNSVSTISKVSKNLLDISYKKKPSKQNKSKIVVEKVCEKLNDEVLTVAEIDILNSFNALQQDETAQFEIPAIRLQPYLFQLVEAMNRWFSDDGQVNDERVGIRCLLLSIFYLRKIKKAEPTFTLSEYNVHRIIAVLMLISAKFTEDEVISNQFWGDMSGLTLEEVNELEGDLCFSSGFDFQVKEDELRETYQEFDIEEIPLFSRIVSQNQPSRQLTELT